MARTDVAPARRRGNKVSRAQSSKTRRESAEQKAPLFPDVPGAIAALLATSAPRAASLPAKNRKPRRKEQPVASPDASGSEVASPRAEPMGRNTTPWQVHASRLEQIMAETDISLVAENTFLTMAPDERGAKRRENSAPPRLGAEGHQVRSGAATPELWEHDTNQESQTIQSPILAHAVPITVGNHELHALPVAYSLPPESTDLLRWLMDNAISSAARISALEERVAHLELANSQLHASLASSWD
mmetsp:Transcript_57598/g.135000  ORF Transcript_57598/g.135000 Transcript_57598/m.135000 type:complete len:245 (+) Transcript_57598:47-781(+)